jgi:hypothetical protein
VRLGAAEAQAAGIGVLDGDKVGEQGRGGGGRVARRQAQLVERVAESPSSWRLSSAKLPRAMIRPPRMIAMRSASTSASARLCVVSRMERSALRSSPIASRTVRALCGSIAVVGSSRKSTGGSWISARTRAIFCFMPLE